MASRRAALITAGLIGTRQLRWGCRPARFAGRTLQRPVVDLEALQAADATLHAWVRKRLVPKLLLATQTRVLSAAADRDGRCVPSVPVIAVEPLDDYAWWLVAAVLWAPVVSVDAANRFAGAGLAAGALRLSARQVLTLPTPIDVGSWTVAAEALREMVENETITGSNADSDAERRFEGFATSMAAAYDIDSQDSDQAKRWWERARLRHVAATVL